jgi:hypothetical protein
MHALIHTPSPGHRLSDPVRQHLISGERRTHTSKAYGFSLATGLKEGPSTINIDRHRGVKLASFIMLHVVALPLHLLGGLQK